MNELGRILLNIGVIFIFAGVVLTLLGKLPFLGKLPGDILVKRENFSVYIPITTALLISLLLSVIFTLVTVLKR